MHSFAQNREDVILARVLGERQRGFYVDVGASDPVVRSVTKHFYDLGWRGVNLEPVARFHRMLERDRPGDVNLCVALGSSPGALTFFEFEAEGISTLSPANAEHFTALGYPCERRTVEVVTLAAVCAAHCPGPIDFLKIDVEGWERQVIEGGDWTRFRPRVLLVEATKPNSTEPTWHEWEPLLLAQGYLFAWFDGLNRFYVRQEDRGLLARFPSRWPILLRTAARRAAEGAARLLGRARGR
jgi:FkbM family methyltransferase